MFIFYFILFYLSHLKKHCTGFPRYLDGDLQLPHRKCDPGCVWGSEEIFGYRASERGMSCSCFGLPFLPPPLTGQARRSHQLMGLRVPRIVQFERVIFVVFSAEDEAEYL